MAMRLDQMVMTRGINEKIATNLLFAEFVADSIVRYYHHDWGDLCESDKKMNDSAIKNNDDRVVARYNNPSGDIYVITEWDGSVTTILFCNEY